MKIRGVLFIASLVMFCFAVVSLADAQSTPSYYFCLDPKVASQRVIERGICDQNAESLCVLGTIPVGYIKPELCDQDPYSEECLAAPACVEGLQLFGCYVKCVGRQ